MMVGKRLNRNLTVLHTESSLGWGGQEIRILEEAKGLTGREHRLIIACQSESELSIRAKEAGLEVITLSMRKISYLSAVLKLRSIIDDYGVDILNTHSSRDSWLGSIAGRLSKKRPIILRTRHLSTTVSRGLLSRFLYEILPHRVITTGESIRNQMITDNGFDGKKIMSIPTGVNIDLFDPKRVDETLRSEWGVPRGVPAIGMVAVIRSWKGHEYFIDAAGMVLKEFPEARFFIVGDGPRKEIVSDYIKERGLHDSIIMIGQMDDIPRVMAALDIVVLSSYANEGLPQVLLQSLAMGKPVVASNVGSISEVIVDGKTGYLIPPRDPSKLAEGIMSFIKRNGLRDEMGMEGRRLVTSRFSLEGMLDRIEDLYKELL
ncbi:MAG: glycosyltransferase [Nitrospirae bacterium]|nr:glycosyltransferase [Nitrospirota bacterium]